MAQQQQQQQWRVTWHEGPSPAESEEFVAFGDAFAMAFATVEEGWRLVERDPGATRKETVRSRFNDGAAIVRLAWRSADPNWYVTLQKL
jgi:hypothetical protein